MQQVWLGIGVEIWVGGLLGHGHIARGFDKLLKLAVGDQVWVDPKAIYRHRVSRGLFGIVVVSPHGKGAARNPHHGFGRGATGRFQDGFGQGGHGKGSSFFRGLSRGPSYRSPR